MKPVNKHRYVVANADLDTFMFNIHEYGISPRSREIYLHSQYWCNEYDEEAFIDYMVATKFEKNINFLNEQSSDNILIHQHTVGGMWNDGIAIYDTIKASVSPVTVLAYAHARSMSSVTIQAADKRVLMPNTDFMVHHGWLSISDAETGALTEAKWAEKMEGVMLKIYADRCKESKFFGKKSKREIMAYIKKKIMEKQHWYMTASEAVYYGFADGVFGTKGYTSLAQIRKA